MKIIHENRFFLRLHFPEVTSVGGLYRLGTMLKTEMYAEFKEQVDDYDQVYLIYIIDGLEFTLTYSVFLGTELFVSKGDEASEDDLKKLLKIESVIKEWQF